MERIDRLLMKAKALTDVTRGYAAILSPSDGGWLYQQATEHGLRERRFDSESAALAAASALRDNVIIVDI